MKRTEILGKSSLSLILILILIPMVNGITLDITLPSSAYEGDLVVAEFEAISSNLTLNYSVFINDELVSNSNSFGWQTNYQDAGTYEFKFVAEDSLNREEETRTIQIQNVPLSVTFEKPTGTYATREFPVEVNTNIQVDLCIYEFEGEQGILNGEGTNWYSNLLASTDGPTIINVSCTNEWDSASNTRNFIIDTTAPVITSSSPTETITESRAELKVTTDETARCKYGKTNEPYSSLPYVFETTEGTESTTLVSNLEQGLHNYYVSCQDLYGNTQETNTIINFEINLAPNVEIELEQSTTLGEGTYEVYVRGSENLVNPTLEYNFQDDAGKRQIALVGNERNWNGFIQIDEGLGEKIGVFHFSGQDETGLTGTTITEGKIFLVDTLPPGEVENLRVEQERKAIMIEWEYAEDDFEFFKVYVSETPGIIKSLEGIPTRIKSYLDTEIKPGETRYYRVSVVDKAGNEGPLSQEFSMTAVPYNSKLSEALNEGSEIELVSSEVLYVMNETLFEADTLIFQAEAILEEIEKADPSLVEVMNILGTVDQAKKSLADIRHARSQIAAVQYQALDDETALKTIKRHLASATQHLVNMPRGIVIEAKREYEQTLDISHVEQAIQDYTLGLEVMNADDYKRSILELQDITTVVTRLYHVREKHSQGSTERTLVVKKVLVDLDEYEGDIVEIVPKTVARQATDIEFFVEPVILRNDPVVSWGYQQLQESEIRYMLKEFKDLDDLQTTKTISMLEPPEKPETAPITGAVTAQSEGGFAFEYVFVLGGILIAGLVAYYFFAFKSEDEKERKYVGEDAPRILPEQQQTVVREVLRPKSDIPLHTDFYSLVEEGEESINKLQVDKAYKLYFEAMGALNEQNGHDKERSIVMLNSLHSKLVLHQLVGKCHKAMDEKKPEDLRRHLTQVKGILYTVDIDTPLFNYVNRVYDYFSNRI